MTEPLLLQAISGRNPGRPPVWFMRQAGRYHRHYQLLRARHEFIDLCKQPQLATEVTMGPIEDFGFDAAILFSDLLFPLEAMGMGLRYAPGPQLDWYLREPADLPRLQGGAARAAHMDFQAEALGLLRARLPATTGLIGFVGGPFTLYAYAVAGSHEGFVRGGLDGLDNGMYEGFNERLCGLLAANMALQAQAGADCVAIFDTAAGTLSPESFARYAAAPLAAVVAELRARCPHTPVIYYSRDTGPAHWPASICSAWVLTGATTLSRCCARRVADGACRAISIPSGCCCRQRSWSRGCAKCFAACSSSRQHCGRVGCADWGMAYCRPRRRRMCGWRSRCSGRCSGERSAGREPDSQV